MSLGLTPPEFVEYGDNNPADDQWLSSLWLMMLGANFKVRRPPSRRMTPREAEKLCEDMGLLKGSGGEDEK